MKKLTLLALMVIFVMLNSQAQKRPEMVRKNDAPFDKELRAKIIKEHGLGLHTQMSIPKGIQASSTIFEDDFTGSLNWGAPIDWALINNGTSPYITYVVSEQVVMAGSDSLSFLISKEIDFTNATYLQFASIGANEFGTSAPNEVTVGIMTNNEDATTFTALDSFNISGVWTNYHIMMENQGAGYLAFQYTGKGYYYLDNILVVADDNLSIDYPNRVTDFSVTSGANGKVEATVAWTNPTKEIDGDAVTLTAVDVYINGVKQHTISDPVAGANESVVLDDSYFNGSWSYSFSVIAVNASGSSHGVGEQTWIGSDRPGAPDTVNFVELNGKPKVTWEAPTKGYLGGDIYYDASSITNYVVLCSNGTRDTVENVLEFIGDTISDPGVYNYSVYAINSVGDGLSAYSAPLAMAQDDYILYDLFDVDPLTSGWTIDGVGEKSWKHGTSAYYGTSYMELLGYGEPEYDGISRIISPKLNTTEAKVLGLDFAHMQGPGFGTDIKPYNFRVETTSDGGETWSTVYSVNVEAYMPLDTFNVVFSNEDVGSENFQLAYTFEGGNIDIYYLDVHGIILQPVEGVDVGVYSIVAPEVIKVGDKVVVEAMVKNKGSEATSLDVTVDYVLNGVSQASSTLTLDNFGIGADSTVTFPEWTSEEGVFDVNVYTAAAEDINPTNDSLQSVLKVINGVDRNLVVIEDFTGTWCAYCPGAQMGIEDLERYNYKVAGIALHAGDAYETNDTKARATYYGVTSFPHVRFDGVVTSVGGSNTESLYETYVSLVDQRMAIATPIKLDIKYFAYNADTKVVTANAVIERTTNSASSNLLLHAVVTESHIDEAWAGQVELNDVARTFYPSADGTAIDLSTSSTQTIEVTFTLEDEWIPEFMELVVFVQDNSTKEIFNGDVKRIKEIENKASVTISVVNDKGAPVEGASVDFDADNMTTDATGKVVFDDVEPGTHIYHVILEGYLPVNPKKVMIGLDDMEFTQELWGGEIIFKENFDTTTLVNGWEIQGHKENWLFGNNEAGGLPYELLMWYSPDFTGISKVVSPNIALKELVNEKDELYFMFKYAVNDYSKQGGYSIRARMISKSNSDTTKYWEVNPRENVLGTQEIIEMAYSDITEDSVRFEFEFDGAVININWWNLDDIWLVKVEGDTTSISDNKVNFRNLNVYPNPARNELHIADGISGELNIYSVTGQYLITRKNYDSNQPINVSNLNGGMYIISVKNNNSIYSTKINIVR